MNTQLLGNECLTASAFSEACCNGTRHHDPSRPRRRQGRPASGLPLPSGLAPDMRLGVLADAGGDGRQMAARPAVRARLSRAVFSLFLLWRRRAMLSAAKPQYNWWGVLLVAGRRGPARRRGVPLLRLAGRRSLCSRASPASASSSAAGPHCGGRGRRRLPALHDPPAVPSRDGLRTASPVHLATLASTYTLQALGLPALAEGNTILLPGGAIGVAEACSGLSMLTTFLALATAVALVVRRPCSTRSSSCSARRPIAIVANVARITATALAQEWVGPEPRPPRVPRPRRLAHDARRTGAALGRVAAAGVPAG